jgi:hypothetical protein
MAASTSAGPKKRVPPSTRMRFGALANAQVENRGENDAAALVTSERFIKSLRSMNLLLA